MGKRLIVECDLTKQEYNPEETVTLTFKKDGKKSGRTYELSAKAAEKLEQQLVAGPEAKLPSDWTFGGSPERKKAVTLETLEDSIEDDSEFVAAKKMELRDIGIISDEARETVENPILFEETDGCRHINKSRIQTTLKNKKRFIYQTCRDCGKKIEAKTMEEKTSYMNSKLPPDVNMQEKIS